MEENKDLTRQDCPSDLSSEAFEPLIGLLEDIIKVLNTELDDCDFCPLIDVVILLLVNPIEDNGVLAQFRDLVRCFIEEAVDETDPDCPPDYGFASQLKRFLCLIDNLEVRLNLIVCTDNESCENLIGDLIGVLVEIMLQLLSLAFKLSVLGRYRCYCEPVGGRVFNLIVCDFINELDFFEELLIDVGVLVIALIDCDIENCTPCYVATKASRE